MGMAGSAHRPLGTNRQRRAPTARQGRRQRHRHGAPETARADELARWAASEIDGPPKATGTDSLSAVRAARLERLTALVDAAPGEPQPDLDGNDRAALLRAGYVVSTSWPEEPALLHPLRREHALRYANWWPPVPRCAELARTATGERRERLLRRVLR